MSETPEHPSERGLRLVEGGGMAEDDIMWEEPPASALTKRKGAHGRYVGFAQTLKEHPGKWALLPGGERSQKSAQGTAANIRRGKGIKGFEEGPFDAVSDGNKVYVRFTGKTEEPEPEGGGTEEQ